MLLSFPFLNHNHGLHLLLNAALHHTWDCFSLLVLTIAISTGLLSGKHQNLMIQENADSDDWKHNSNNSEVDQSISTALSFVSRIQQAEKDIREAQKQEEETADVADDRSGDEEEDVLRESQCSNEVDDSEQPQESIQGKALSLENKSIDGKAEKIIRAEKEEEQTSVAAGDEKGADEEPIDEGEEEDALCEPQCSTADDSDQNCPAKIRPQILQVRESC